MLVVGLTGGIGCGKTAASQRFAYLGVPVIDADQVSRELTIPGTAVLQAIVECFGNEVLASDGTLDRATLRERVFADPAQRQQLEAILHPAIRRAMEERLAALHAPYAILVIPLLIETGQQALVDRILPDQILAFTPDRAKGVTPAVLLLFVGLRMIRGGFAGKGEEALPADPSRGWRLVVLSVATSIDALAVGLTFGVLAMEVLLPALVIGVVSCGMTLVGIFLGRRLQGRFGSYAEIVGGLILIGIGVKIFLK